MQLQYPPPIRSKYDPQTVEADIDYSMSSPLLADGSNYPCKGYNTPGAYEALKPVATLNAGSLFKVQFAAGGATHYGGSCQFSVSYDQGKTFAVIYSIEGGCPLSLAYSVPIPATLPSSKKATFAWTWVSRATREMYGNCAVVAINGDDTSKSFTGPGLYRANTLADGSCITPNDADVVYPNPGRYVEYGGSITSASRATILDPCSYNQVTTVTISPSGSSSGTTKPSPSSKSPSATSSSSAGRSAAQPTATAAATTSSSSTGSTSVSSLKTPVKSRVPWMSRHVLTGSPATQTTKAAAPTTTLASSRSATSSTRATSAAPVATQSPAGNSTTEAPSGVYLKCLSAQSFALCVASDCTDMGSVAPGTVCQDNQIVMAPAVKVKRMDKVVVRRAGPAFGHSRPYAH
ncbi:hypothetical protein JCM10908_003871 [Rhodotorula pacifica]|uniref:uncharacterized protein n=1 Tax=Rhodotorula pacifica TaxID=1495444 RepID=UPI00317D3668